MRAAAADVAIRSEIGFEEDLMRRLVETTLDIGLMYTPSHAPGLVVEHLFDETLVLVSSDPDIRWPDENYIYVDWGPGFYAKHRDNYPDPERPPQVANIGSLGYNRPSPMAAVASCRSTWHSRSSTMAACLRSAMDPSLPIRRIWCSHVKPTARR